MTRALGAIVASVAIVTHHGASTRVLFTSDGRTWRDVTPHRLGRNVDDALFADSKHGWIVTSDCAAGKGAVLRTRDGGRTWPRRPLAAPTCNAGAGTTLDFLDRRHGWAIRAEPTAPFEALSVTADGGASWRFVSRDLPVVGPVLFRTRRTGWLGGLRLYRTRDGGRQWRRIRVPTPRGHRNPERASDSFAPPVFYSRKALLAASFVRGKRLLVWIYTTSDLGRHWIVNARFHGKSSAAFWPGTLASAPRSKVQWVVTGRRLYLTADRGAHWSRRPLRFTVEKLVALDGRTAIVETTAGAALVTHNGGKSWRRVAT